jgi:hypothetical protein
MPLFILLLTMILTIQLDYAIFPSRGNPPRRPKYTVMRGLISLLAGAVFFLILNLFGRESLSALAVTTGVLECLLYVSTRLFSRPRANT